MNYFILKIIHITGLTLAFMGLAGVLAGRMADGPPRKTRWWFQAAHGLGLLLLIATGMAMAAQLRQSMDTPVWPGWIKAKFVIWLLAGAAMGLTVRFGPGRFSGLLLLFFAALAAGAAWLAIAKPF